jgi:hypothetical protein
MVGAAGWGTAKALLLGSGIDITHPHDTTRRKAFLSQDHGSKPPILKVITQDCFWNPNGDPSLSWVR